MSEIPLTNGGVALVNDDDVDIVLPYTWYWVNFGKKTKTKYACAMETTANGKQRVVLMHRLIMGVSGGIEVDHKNRDGLDNRRENLRIATRSQQMANAAKRNVPTTSKYKGVCWVGKKWQAKIVVNGRQIYLGSYVIEEDAARAYDEGARRHFGEFARTNF